MKQVIYYTVISGKSGHSVRYAVAPAYTTASFAGTFADPGEASQQFKQAMQGNLEYLKEGQFQRKVGQLAYRYQQEIAKLLAWNAGKA